MNQHEQFGRHLLRREIARNILHAQHSVKLEQLRQSVQPGNPTPAQSELQPVGQSIHQRNVGQTGELQR